MTEGVQLCLIFLAPRNAKNFPAGVCWDFPEM